MGGWVEKNIKMMFDVAMEIWRFYQLKNKVPEIMNMNKYEPRNYFRQ